MPRYQLIIEYDGTDFVGWQRQSNGLAVQEVLETAGAALTSGGGVAAVAAGRTDTGVHAKAMGAHIDLEKDLSADAVRDGLNFHMRPHPVSVLQAREVVSEFHARFSCVGRVYEYRIANQRAPLALMRARAWRVAQPLDIDAMHEAAQEFVGRHDFTTFRASACQAASPVKSLDRFSVTREQMSNDAGDMIILQCAAISFLHNQVRSMVGSLVDVGRGKWDRSDVASAIAAKDRSRCGPVAPAEGLYFVRAVYPNAT